MKQLPKVRRIQGIVTPFKGNGRKLGYPTANLAIATALDDGVYLGYADLAEYTHQPAIIFVGTPTTVGDTVRRVEAYLLDVVDRDYYGQEMTLSIVAFHRAHETFASVDVLLKAMHGDELAAREWFKNQPSDAGQA